MMKEVYNGAKNVLDFVKDTSSDTLKAFFPHMNAKNKAVDYYIKMIENSDMDDNDKVIAIYQAKKIIREWNNQTNIVEIAHKAAKKGTDFSIQAKVDTEWLERFMDAAKFVSDEKMQLVWGRVLAGEFESPGKTPKSLIRILSETSVYHAEVFSNLCKLGIGIAIEDNTGKVHEIDNELIIPTQGDAADFLEELNITQESLNELEILGLIVVNFLTGFSRTYDEDAKLAHIYNGEQEITKIVLKNRKLRCGNVYFTNAGKCLSEIIGFSTNEDFIDFQVKYLKE